MTDEIKARREAKEAKTAAGEAADKAVAVGYIDPFLRDGIKSLPLGCEQVETFRAAITECAAAEGVTLLRIYDEAEAMDHLATDPARYEERTGEFDPLHRTGLFYGRRLRIRRALALAVEDIRTGRADRLIVPSWGHLGDIRANVEAVVFGIYGCYVWAVEDDPPSDWLVTDDDAPEPSREAAHEMFKRMLAEALDASAAFESNGNGRLVEPVHQGGSAP